MSLPLTSPLVAASKPPFKSAGEVGADGSPPTLINAIVDALAELGIDHIDMPATPEVVWRCIREAMPRRAA
jgi:aerobic carbon-monoxide dehydrogenase large subunit